jgi:hypothetical protein
LPRVSRSLGNSYPEAAGSTETLVTKYQTTLRYKPEDHGLNLHRHENHNYHLYGIHPVVCYLGKYIIWESRTTNNQKDTK